MGPALDFSAIAFGEPVYLWLLGVPGILLALWLWEMRCRRADVRRLRRQRVLPVPERYALVGDLALWLCLTVSIALCILALARPQARVVVPGVAGADFVILQDGSASMYVTDTTPDRWQRSMRFVRTFADTLSWKQDRVGLALFAYFAAPQVRLTKDPNALFFFLEHLADQSPFRLEDDPTWNTNIEEGVEWGLRLVEANEELFGKTTNPKVFIVISDGQAWSGRVATALAQARVAEVSVHVVGVGTTAGGYIPSAPGRNAPLSRVQASLDRDSLRAIARAGRGEYFEIGRESDRAIAESIISSARRRAPTRPQEESRVDLYWRFLCAAAAVLCVGVCAVRQRAELWWQALGAIVAGLILASAGR